MPTGWKALWLTILELAEDATKSQGLEGENYS